MEFGLTWAKLDEMEYVTEAEKLGFTHLWVTDSGLIRSDAFVFLTVAAQQTRTMKLGMGVAVPGLRLAPTLAGGMARTRCRPTRTYCSSAAFSICGKSAISSGRAARIIAGLDTLRQTREEAP